MAPPRLTDDGQSHADRFRLVTFLNGVVEQETARLVRDQTAWTAWLKHAARHGRYGFANTLLICAQRPSATEVQSYPEWRRQSRQVRRGETGIRLLTRNGGHGTVFDITQTDGPSRPSQRDPGKSWEGLANLAADLGVWIERQQRWVYTGPPGRVVHIDPALDEDEAATMLAHQLAHVHLHDLADRPGDDAVACHGVRQVEADSVAYLLLAHLGVTDPAIRFATVASWAGTDPRAQPAAAVKAVAERVLSTTAHLTKRLRRPDDTPAHQPTAAGPEPKLGASVEELAAIQMEAHQVFQRWWDEGNWVREYLSERGFTPEVQKQWGVGYAPRAWRSMTDHLLQQGHSEKTILAAGLARRTRDGRLIDTFRDRAIFPIRRPDGAIAGFIGRARGGAVGPKYVNSPASPLYRKGELLFGLYEVRDRLARGAMPVLVEGPLDAIAINIAVSETHAAIAPCGTAITSGHLATLADATSKELVLALDGDEAGQRAMLSSWDVLAPTPGPLYAAVLPRGQDPADLLRTQGHSSIGEVLAEAGSLTDLVVDKAIEQSGRSLQHPDEQLAALRAAAAVLARRPPSEYAHQAARIAARLNIAPAHVTAVLAETISVARASPSHLARQNFPRPPSRSPTAAKPPASACRVPPAPTARRAK